MTGRCKKCGNYEDGACETTCVGSPFQAKAEEMDLHEISCSYVKDYHREFEEGYIGDGKPCDCKATKRIASALAEAEQRGAERVRLAVETAACGISGCECKDDANEAARSVLDESKSDISLCGNGGGCMCVTKTIDGRCGKCGASKLKPV